MMKMLIIAVMSVFGFPQSCTPAVYQ